MNTHQFVLPSGVNCEICELTGAHQEIYLDKKTIKNGTNYIKFLSSVVVGLGDKKGDELTEKDILKLLSQDARAIILEVKKFDRGDEPFEFEYSFQKDGKNYKHPISIDLNEVEITPCLFQYKSYEEVEANKKLSVVLPKTKKEVFFKLGDLETELKAPAKDPSIFYVIENRRPYYVVDNKEISLDIRRLPAKDVNFLAGYIRKCEGFVDTIVQFENPYIEGDLIMFDFLNVKDFLFQGLL